jgi:hypothetical protein
MNQNTEIIRLRRTIAGMTFKRSFRLFTIPTNIELEPSFFQIIVAFGILNLGHAQRRRLRRVLRFIWNLIFVVWDFQPVRQEDLSET